MADIFVSYKREERAEVERLVVALRGLGLDVWFDASLSAGEAFSDEINREVRAAKAVLVCWSEAAASSQWVKAEANIGFSKQNLISVYIAGPDGFDPPVPFNGLHMQDMRAWTTRPSGRDPAFLSVLRTVGRLTNRADIAEWAALGVDASIAQIDGWFAAHQQSPLVIEAESFLSERKAAERERVAAEQAARDRLAREAAERAAAEERRRADEAEQRRRDEAERVKREAEARRRAEEELVRKRREDAAAAERQAVIDERRREQARKTLGIARSAVLLALSPLQRSSFGAAGTFIEASSRLAPRFKRGGSGRRIAWICRACSKARLSHFRRIAVGLRSLGEGRA